MASMPSLDPYKALGVDKNASLTEIRSAHRKLVLKCHPDKVHDESLKAIKQDQFQKVQEAYEILSDENRRQEYDHRIRIIEMRNEAAKSNQAAGSGVYEFEVKTTDDKWGHRRSTVKVYAYSTPYSTPFSKSHEELHRGERRSSARKSSHMDSDRRRSSTREAIPKKSALPKKHSVDDEEKLRRAEKETRKEKQRAKERKEKEKRRGSEESRARKATAYFEDASEDDFSPTPPRRTEKSSRRPKADGEPKIRDENPTPASARRASAAEAETSRTTTKEESKADKWIEHQNFAGAYMQAAKEKGALPGEIHAAPPKIRRAETYATPSTTSPYNIRFTKVPAPHYSEDNLSRRAAKPNEKKATDIPSSRKKSKDFGNSPPSYSHESREFFPTEQPSTPLPGRKPPLKKYSSAPPSREKFSSTPTHAYARDSAPIPPMSRAQTYTETRSHNRKQEVFSESESDLPAPNSHRRSVKTSYSLDNGRTTAAKTSRHRAEHRSSEQYLHGRSLSPQTHQPNARNISTSDYHNFTRSSQTFEFIPEPDPSTRTTYPRATSTNVPGPRVSFSDINYTPIYGYGDAIYATHVPPTFTGQEYGRSPYPAPRDGKRNSVYAL
ncbi:hypothetical protein K3495_g7388 [Podosphaera aphanis]|nr:hypothetical protein K3495_g7388 [Podosphaera aphanis]